MTADFYVYEHWRPDTNQCFYVGKGRGGRAHRRTRRNKHWGNIVNKLGAFGLVHDVRILKTGLNGADAALLEIECIKFWKEVGTKLVNMTDGGEGALGRRLSEAEKENLRKFNTGKVVSAETRLKSSLALRNPSAETRAKISAGSRGRVSPNRGKPLSFEHRLKLSLAGMGRTMPPEVRAKVAAAGRGRTLSPEAKAKIGAAARVSRTGSVIPPETRAKISLGMKAYKAKINTKDKK